MDFWIDGSVEYWSFGFLGSRNPTIQKSKNPTIHQSTNPK